jgi:PAS domain S-box-containing protein
MNLSKPSVEWRRIAAASMEEVGLMDGDDLVHANDALADTYGYETPADLVEAGWRACYEPDERERIERDALAKVRDGREWRGEATGLCADGSTFAQEASFAAAGEEALVWIVREVTDRTDRERELERYETIIETVDDGVYTLDENLRFDFVNDAFCTMIGLSREEVLGTFVMDLFTDEDETALANEIRERVLAGDTSTGTIEGTYEREDGGTVYTEARFRLHPTPEDGFAGSIGIVRDITERKRRERALERQRDELETLNRINDLLLEITRELFGTPTREDIERTVCEHLADSELYEFAWIGEPAPDGDRIVPRASTGVDDGYVESATITTDEADTGRGPAGRAFRTGDVQVSQDITTDPAFEPWREAALDRGVRSAAAVPLTYGGTVYGLLSVYASRPLAFSRREQAGFETLGEAVGFAIHAAKTRRLLFADAVLELEFRLADGEGLFLEGSERFDCELSLEGYVATKPGGWLCYVGVRGASPAALCEATADRDGLGDVRVVRDDATEGLIEYRFDGPCLFGTLADSGAELRVAEVIDGTGRFVVEAPIDANVRVLAERVRAVRPHANLVAKRERDRSVAEVTVPDGPLDRLTDRQHEALEAAYRAGYFDWPRESTAEEVAGSLEVSSPTLHRHLRRAEKRLLSAFFDADSSP